MSDDESDIVTLVAAESVAQVADLVGLGDVVRGLAEYFTDKDSPEMIAVRDRFRSELCDMVLEHDRRLARLEEELFRDGKKLDELDTIVRSRLFREFCESQADATTPEKRALIVEIAARQADPRLGPRAHRAFLWRVVRELRDEYVYLLRLLSRGRVMVGSNADVYHEGGGGTADSIATGDEGAALAIMLIEIAEQTHLVVQDQKESYYPEQRAEGLSESYKLSGLGRAVAALLPSTATGDAPAA